ncbi:MAG: copper chaperone PCu(A)C [Betaproteobacteria bacterium]
MKRAARAASVATLALLALALPAIAQVTFANGWMRPVASGDASAEAYVDLDVQTAQTLVAAATPIARAVELVEGLVVGKNYRTRVVDAFELPPHATFRFARYANVLRLRDIGRDARVGDVVAMQFTLRDGRGGLRTVSAGIQVRGIGPGVAVEPAGRLDDRGRTRSDEGLVIDRD